MTEEQKCWDAALIKIWRTQGTIHDAMSLFTALTGKLTDQCDPPLKRVPRNGMPFKIGIRVFVATYLPKINDRLWDQPPDKDVLLLRKLQTSNYDTLKSVPISAGEAELRKVKRSTHANNAISVLNIHKYSERNNATDWNVSKGPYRLKIRR